MFISRRALCRIMREKTDTGLKLAIEAAGTGDRLASLLGITAQAVSQWEKIPLQRVFDVERVTKIPRSQLRPDFFGENAA